MQKKPPKTENCDFFGHDFSSIKNRNEQRVLKIMKELLDAMPHYEPTTKELSDIYALSLNSLPARYAQFGTIILRDPVREEHIKKIISTTITKIKENPKP